jgi:acetylornithine/N-succinyldiaminopimelate aminotransferase
MLILYHIALIVHTRSKIEIMSAVLRCSGYELVKHDIQFGDGCYLFDAPGKRYLDLEAGDWGASLGHSHARINRVIQAQSQRLMHIAFTYTTPIVEQAARAVLDVVGLQDGQCLFLSSGSEAVEFAVQAALKSSGKPKFLTMVDSFLASYGSAGSRPPEQWHCFDWAECDVCPKVDACDPRCEKIAALPFGDLAAWVFEPGSSSGLIRFPPQGLIRVINSKIREYDGILIANEVTTGMGRTGKWFGHQHYDLKPDIIALGKGLGNGYPVSAVVMRDEVARSLLERGFRYAQSHQNDPLGCAVAREVIRVMQDKNLIEHSRQVGEYFLAELQRLADQSAHICEVRGRGLMLAVQFNRASKNMARQVFYDLLEHGFIVGCKPDPNLIRFLPPLLLAHDNASDFVETFDAVLLHFS